MKTIKKQKQKLRQTQSTKLRTDGSKNLSLKGDQVHQENYFKEWIEKRNRWISKWRCEIEAERICNKNNSYLFKMQQLRSWFCCFCIQQGSIVLTLSRTNMVNKWTVEPGIKKYQQKYQQFVDCFMFCILESSRILPQIFVPQITCVESVGRQNSCGANSKQTNRNCLRPSLKTQKKI